MYKIFRTLGGYQVAKIENNKTAYIRQIYNNNYVFTLDYSAAKVFTLATARKHLKALES